VIAQSPQHITSRSFLARICMGDDPLQLVRQFGKACDARAVLCMWLWQGMIGLPWHWPAPLALSQILEGEAVTSATSLRATGATTSTAGKATVQLVTHAPPQADRKSGWNPMARYVAMPETRQDIMPDKNKLNR
jgi:hypothetical protein